MVDRSVMVRLGLDNSAFNRGLVQSSAATRAFVKDLDSADSRMTNIVQTSLALGPALIPILGASAVAVAGLTSGLGFLAAGGGVAIAAFSGIGDALEAVNNAALEPSEANLEKMRAKLEELGPAGQDFVLFLQSIRPEMQELQDLAQEGLLPGAQEGIEELLELLPQVERIIANTSTTMGDLLAEGGDNLNNPEWREFFTYLETEAKPILTAMGRTIGNLSEGFAHLLMAVDPLSDDFGSAFLRMSRDFSEWAQGLDETEGFQEFVDYIRANGPRVAETLGALGDMFLAIVTAAAPVGSAVLPVIEALADTLASIARSPAGPILIGAAAGISALSRAVALYNVANGSAITSMLGRLNKNGPGLALRGTAAGIGLLALELGGLADESTGTGDALDGLSKTAGGALLGFAVGGPWGAAIGGGIGLLTSFAGSSDEAAAAQARLDAAAQSFAATLDEQTGKLTAQSYEDIVDALQEIGAFDAADKLGVDLDLVTQAASGSGKALKELNAELEGIAAGIAPGSQADTIAKQLGDPSGTSEKYREVMVLIDAVRGAVNQQSGTVATAREIWDQNTRALEGTKDAQGRMRGGVDDATAAIDDQVVSIQELIDAQHELAGQSLSVFESQTALRQAMIDARKAAREFEGDIDKGGQKAVNARDELARLAGEWNNLAPKVQNATGNYKAFRDSLVATAVEMGMGRLAARRLAASILELPRKHVVKATFESDKAFHDARQLAGAYNDLSLDVRTDIAANGVSAFATVKSLMAEYEGLSRKEAVTILRAHDLASGPINTVKVKITDLDGDTATVTINHRQVNTIATHYESSGRPQPGSADGNLFDYYGSGGFTTIGAQQPQIQPNRGPGGIVWAETGAGPWEAFISGHPAKRDRSRGIADETVHRLGGDIMWMADGGLAERLQGTQAALRSFNVRPSDDAREVRGAVHDLTRTLRDLFGRDADWIQGIDRLGTGLVTSVSEQDRLQRSMEGLREELQGVRQESRQYQQGVASSIDNDIFGNGVEGLDLQLRADTNDNQRMLRALKRARRRGLDGGLFEALAASGDFDTAQELSRMRRGQINRYENRFDARNRAQGALGRFAADRVFGQELNQMTRELRQISRSSDRYTRVIERQERVIERASERGTYNGTRRGLADRNAGAARSRRASRR